jgi:hypothetical protein
MPALILTGSKLSFFGSVHRFGKPYYPQHLTPRRFSVKVRASLALMVPLAKLLTFAGY